MTKKNNYLKVFPSLMMLLCIMFGVAACGSGSKVVDKNDNIENDPNGEVSGNEEEVPNGEVPEDEEEAPNDSEEVGPIGEAPIAYPQEVTLELDSKLPIRLTGLDPQQSDLIFEIASQPENGDIKGYPPQVFYVPNFGYTGSDSFSFQAMDEDGNYSEPAKVSINVRHNQVLSSHLVGPTNDLYAHIPNHLVYRDIGPNQFKLSRGGSFDALQDEATSRNWLEYTWLNLDLGDRVLQPPYTVTMKWKSDQEGGTILTTSDFTIEATQGTDACNHVAMVVNDSGSQQYVNGIHVSSKTFSAALSGELQLGPYPGYLWDLRVYKDALTTSEVANAAQDCSGQAQTPFDGSTNAFTSDTNQYPEVVCGVYACVWYKTGLHGATKEEALHYMNIQEVFYEHNVFVVGMHGHGEIGDFYANGRGLWDRYGKWRDHKLDDRWTNFARVDDPFEGEYWLHEDFHQYQSTLTGYVGSGNPGWVAEGTASWAVLEYNPTSDDLWIMSQYILDAHHPFWDAPRVEDNGIFASRVRPGGGVNGGHRYGTQVFYTYLTEAVLSSKAIGDFYNRPFSDNNAEILPNLYELLAEQGVDMRDMFIEFAARTATYDYKFDKADMTEVFRAIEKKSLKELARSHVGDPKLENPDVKSDDKFTVIYDHLGTQGKFVEPPEGFAPGGWGYNTYKVNDAQGVYKISIDNYDHELSAMVVLYDEEADQQSYFPIPRDKLASGIEVEANGEDILLVVAATTSDYFWGQDTFPYSYSIKVKGSESDSENEGGSESEGEVDSSQPTTGKLRVFVLAGQSNMVGYGYVEGPNAVRPNGTLSWLLEQENLKADYQHLVDANGAYTVRDDVWLSFMRDFYTAGYLTTGFGNPGDMKSGPELGFGHVMGDALEDPILLIKIAEGGKSLAVDFRPPSSGGTTGAMYTKLVDDVAAVLADPAAYYPDYDGREVELAGLVWFQGWNDFVLTEYVDEYQDNMVNLVRDVRDAWDTSELPFVIAETGNACAARANPRGLATCAAQKAVTELAEFSGQAAYVRTRDYYFDRLDSPYDNATHHWRGNFQSYYLIGNDMGHAMLPLIK